MLYSFALGPGRLYCFSIATVLLFNKQCVILSRRKKRLPYETPVDIFILMTIFLDEDSVEHFGELLIRKSP